MAIIEAKETVYGRVADCLWLNKADDTLIARIADAFQADYSFSPRDFLERAYGLNTPHP